VFIYIIENEG